MLHLAGRVRLGVDVADLLELERALHGHRHADAAAEEQRASRRDERRGSVLDVAQVGQDRLDDVGDVGQLGEQRRHAVVRQRALDLRELEREHGERGDLRGERLGRRDADLRTGVRVDDAVGLARHPRARPRW